MYQIETTDYELFVHLPKVCWVAVYQLLDTSSLFRAQRVCKQWRNLINQPIIWVDRAAAEELWMKALELRTGHGNDRPWELRHFAQSDDTESLVEDPTEIWGSENVAVMKRICKSGFIKRAVTEQHFHPKSQKALSLLDQAGTAGEDSQEHLWADALKEEICGKIYFDRARHFEQAEQYANSICDYQSAVQICPYDHNIRTRLGLTYHKQDNLQDALRNYLKTAALCPGYQLAWNNAGSIFFNTGMYDRAEKCFTRCIGLGNQTLIVFQRSFYSF